MIRDQDGRITAVEWNEIDIEKLKQLQDEPTFTDAEKAVMAALVKIKTERIAGTN